MEPLPFFDHHSPCSVSMEGAEPRWSKRHRHRDSARPHALISRSWISLGQVAARLKIPLRLCGQSGINRHPIHRGRVPHLRRSSSFLNVPALPDWAMFRHPALRALTKHWVAHCILLSRKSQLRFPTSHQRNGLASACTIPWLGFARLSGPGLRGQFPAGSIPWVRSDARGLDWNSTRR
jgi:hypothetical protein